MRKTAEDEVTMPGTESMKSILAQVADTAGTGFMKRCV